MDWQKEVGKLVASHFNSFGVKYDYKIKRNIISCLIDFMNLELKLIKPAPRAIFKSDKVKALQLPPQIEKALRYIEEKVIKGVNLAPHQSSKILSPTYNDLLLNDWLIHHIHISDEIDEKDKRFYKRSGYLLFVAFSPSQAFFIDMQKHGRNEDFAQKEFLEIMCKNWPTLMDNYLVNDVHDLSHDLTNSQIHTTRQKGVSVGMIKINGKIYMSPGVGIMTSGTNIHVVRRAQDVYRRLMLVFDEVEKNPEGVKKDLSGQAGREIRELDLLIKKIEEYPYFVVYERNSDLILAYNPN